MTTQTANGHGVSAVRNVSPTICGPDQIVSHPDRPDEFAILDVYGDYVRNHHGYVQPFSKKDALAALGLEAA